MSSLFFHPPRFTPHISAIPPLGGALSALQGLTDIHTDANDTTGFGALCFPSSPPSSYQFQFLVCAPPPLLVLTSWAIRQRQKSQLTRGGNQTSFSCPFNIGINFLQG